MAPLHPIFTALVDAWSSFYKDLFSWSSVDSSVQDEMLDNLESCVSHPEAMQCEGSLSTVEVLEDLQNLQPQNPLRTHSATKLNAESDIESGNETERQEMSEGKSESDADGEMVIDPTPQTSQDQKRARPESNPASDNDAILPPPKLQAIPLQATDDSTVPEQPSQTNNTPQLFSVTSPPDTQTDTTTTPKQQAQMDQTTGPSLQKFLNALKSNGPARQHLIKTKTCRHLLQGPRLMATKYTRRLHTGHCPQQMHYEH